MQDWNQSTFIYFKVKFYEDWVSKFSQKIGFFVLSTGHQNCMDKSLNISLSCPYQMSKL